MASVLHTPQVTADMEAQLPSYSTQSFTTQQTSRPATPATLIAGERSNEKIPELPELPSEKDERFLVTFDGPDDPENPLNWSKAYRWYLTFMASFLVLNATFASSAPSGLVLEMMAYFQISREVGALLISLFVGGYCVCVLLRLSPFKSAIDICDAVAHYYGVHCQSLSVVVQFSCAPSSSMLDSKSAVRYRRTRHRS